LHLAAVKGPVMDRLERSHFLQELTGKVHLTHFDAVASIKPELTNSALQSARATVDNAPADARPSQR
jgi:SulP family sulfate permease